MREVRYKHHPAVGGSGSWTRSDLVTFLFALPRFFRSPEQKQPLPPRHVFNQLLARGKDDAGMSGCCEWHPFELTEEEYRELADELATRPDLHFVDDPSLAACRNLDERRGKAIFKYSKRRES